MILILSLVAVLISCGGMNSDNNTDKGNNSFYDDLNRFSSLRYEKVNLYINLSGNGAVLNSYFELSDDKIVYSVEKLNRFPTDGDITNISPDYKTIYSGTASVANGVIVKMDDNDIILPEYTELSGSFNFKQEYFTNIVNENGKFTADVISASGFLGRDVAVENMKCSVEYNEDSFVKIVLNYLDGGVQVTSVYEFAR